VNVEQQIEISNELRNHVITLVEDPNGNHVIQKCLERMPAGKVQFIIDAFRSNMRRMATHCYGSRVLQRIVEYCDPEHVIPVYDEIHNDCLSVFIHDQYGNYVIQNMVEYGRKSDRQLVMELVYQYMATMSCHKYASNIVEKSLQQASDEERKIFVSVVLGQKPPGVKVNSDPENPPLVTMMKDKFGNYVVQRLMQLADDDERNQLITKLKECMGQLEKMPYGKHILFALKEGDYGFGEEQNTADSPEQKNTADSPEEQK